MVGRVVRGAWLCPYCRYDVSGLGDGRTVVCPECGKAVDRFNPYGLKPWPRPWVLMVHLGWSVPVGLAMLRLAAVGGVSVEASIALLVLMLVIAPVCSGHVLTARHADPHERWLVWAGLVGGGVVLNTALMFALAVVVMAVMR